MAKLSDLKKLVDAARVKAPATGQVRKSPMPRSGSSSRTLAASEHRDGDIDLTEAFADVHKLPPARKAATSAPRPAPIPRQRIADDADALATSKFGADPAREFWEIGQEHEAEQTYVRRGVGIDVLTKLRRGQWSVQGDIDLHGHSIDQAHDALADFLDDARAHGYRCVRIVHGKGLTSPNKVPILKGKVRRWLSQWDDVLAYCEAPQHAGGGGAVLVLLRGR